MESYKNACFTSDAIEEKFIHEKRITALVWSPALDIFALGNIAGSVIVYKYRITLNWESVTSGFGAVTTLAWRPDGFLLVVGYSNGIIRMLHYQDGFEIKKWKINSNENVISFNWMDSAFTQDKHDEKISSIGDYFTEFSGLCSIFKGESSNPVSAKKLESYLQNAEKSLSILIACTQSRVILYAGGILPIYILQMSNLDPSFWSQQHRIICANFSKDLSELTVCCQFKVKKSEKPSNQTERKYSQFTVPILFDSAMKTEFILASWHALSFQIHIYLLNKVLERIKSFWEDSISDIETKLSNYVQLRLESCKVSYFSFLTFIKTFCFKTELLKALLFGTVSNELSSYLQDKWGQEKIIRAAQNLLATYQAVKLSCSQDFHYVVLSMLFLTNELMVIANFHKDFTIDEETKKIGHIPLPIRSENLCCLSSDLGSLIGKLHSLHVLIDDCSGYLQSFFNFLLSILDSDVKSKQLFPAISDDDFEKTCIFIEEILAISLDAESNTMSCVHLEFIEQYLKSGGLKNTEEVPRTHSDATQLELLKNFVAYSMNNLGSKDKLKSLDLFKEFSNLFKVDQNGELNISFSVFGLDEINPDCKLPSEAFFKSSPSATLCDVVDTVVENIPKYFSEQFVKVDILDAQVFKTHAIERVTFYEKEVNYGHVPIRQLIYENNKITFWCGQNSLYILVSNKVQSLKQYVIKMDRHCLDSNPENQPYVMQDVEFFFKNSCLNFLVLFSRSSDEGTSLNWFAMFSSDSIFSLNHFGQEENGVETFNICASEIFVSASQFQELNRTGAQLIVNARKGTIMVVYTNQFCQVFFLDQSSRSNSDQIMDVNKVD